MYHNKTIAQLLISEPHTTADGSRVHYFIKDGQEWVKHTTLEGITRYAEFSFGSWMDESTFKTI